MGDSKSDCVVQQQLLLVDDWQGFLKGPAAANVTTSTSATATLLLDMHSELGEGILYDDEKKQVVWTDILGRKFHCLSMNDDNNKGALLSSFELPKMLGSFGLLTITTTMTTTTTTTSKQQLLTAAEAQGDSSYYLFAWEDGFQIYNPATLQAWGEMSQGEAVNPHQLPTRLNDGRCDPTGTRFICGGYFGEREDVTMKVFSCQWNTETQRLTHEPMMENVRVTNSLQFSPDGKTLYFADSPTKQIVAYDYNREQAAAATTAASSLLLSNKRLLYTVDLEGAVPDGSCVDADGYLWNATWWNGKQSSRVRRIDPTTGKVVFEVHIPDTTSQVSCCCFGGPELDILFITTAGEGRDAAKEPHAGGLYAIKLEGVKGRLEHRFHVG